MTPSIREHGLRIACLVAIGFSALILAEYAGDAPALCGLEGGCETVRSSAYAYPLGIPLPVFGIAFYTLLLTTTVWPKARALVLPLASAGAVGGLGFIAIQGFVLGAFCWMCLIVDGTAVAIGVLALSLRKHQAPAPTTRAWAAYAAVLALIVGGGFGARSVVASDDGPVVVPITPSGPDDKVAVVEYFDFGCPHCQELHGELKPVLAEYAHIVHVDMKPLPLRKSTEPSARAYCCAFKFGQGPAMADKLFSRKGEATADECVDIAAKLGIDRDEFAACTESDETSEKLKENQELAGKAKVRGLPTFWIGSKRFEGVYESDDLRESIELARSKINAPRNP